MLNRLTQRIVTGLFLLAFSVIGYGMGVAMPPFVPSNIVIKELLPLLDYLQQSRPDSRFVHASNRVDFIALAREGELDLVYVDAAYASLLKQQGYIPLLVSQEGLQLQISSLSFRTLADVHVSTTAQRPSVYFARDDIQAEFYIQESLPGKRLQHEAMRSVDQAMMQALSNKTALVILSSSDFQLLMEPVRQRFNTISQVSFGYMYLMLHPRHQSHKKVMAEHMMWFHENWKNDSKKYVFLNLFTFRYWKEEDHLLRNTPPNLREYLKQYQ